MIENVIINANKYNHPNAPEYMRLRIENFRRYVFIYKKNLWRHSVSIYQILLCVYILYTIEVKSHLLCTYYRVLSLTMYTLYITENLPHVRLYCI